MKKVLFLTNFASPYRVRFFDELGKTAQVTVLYSDRVEDMTHRDKRWFQPGAGGFIPVQLKASLTVKDEYLCLDVLKWLNMEWDAIVIGGYSSPTAVLAMLWLRLRGRPFFMEVDGGLIRKESGLKYFIKKRLVTLAPRWISSGRYPSDYLVHYGAKREKIGHYPFSSLTEGDIRKAPVSRQEKRALREELGIAPGKMVLAVGQFIYRKGFDVLLEAAKSLDGDAAVYIVGGQATEEYIRLRRELGVEDRVQFLGFQNKETLAKFYRAADVFVLPTREDIWGLVINEAMAYGLPVITTDRCVAGLELVEDGVNGFIVPVGDAEALGEKIREVLSSDLETMGAASLEKVRPYTIENMAKCHLEIFEKAR